LLLSSCPTASHIGPKVDSFVNNLHLGFWIKQNVYYETANADFKGPLVINVLKTSGYSQTYSTVNGINKMYDADWIGAVPTISVSREMNPKNGLLQNIRLNIDLLGIKPEQIAQV